MNRLRTPLPWLALVLAAVVIAAVVRMALWFGQGAPLNTGVTELVPVGAMAERDARLLRQLVDGAAGRVVVMIEANEIAAVEGAAMMLESGLDEIEGIAAVDARPDPSRLDALAAVLQPWRDSLLSPADRAALQADPAGAVTRWMEQPAFLRPLPERVDPLGTLGRFLAGAFQVRAGIESDGFFYWLKKAGDEPHAVVLFVSLEPDALGSDAADRVVAAIERQALAVESAHAVDIFMSGAVIHGAGAKQRARLETTVFGVTGSILVALLLAWLFGGPGPVLMAVAVVGTALTCGFAVAVAGFDELHALTLVLAVPVIGIAVDYLIHGEVHRRIGGSGALSPSLMRALLLACASSVLAYAAVGVAGIALLQQVSVVVATGLIVALAMVVLFAGRPLRGSARGRIQALAGSRWVTRLCAGVPFPIPALTLTIVLIVALSVAAFASGRVRVVDSPAALSRTDDSIAGADARIGRRLDTRSMRTRLVVEGASVAELLEREEDAIRGLEEQLDIPATGLSSLVPSFATQRTNRDLVATAYRMLDDEQRERLNVDVAAPESPTAAMNLTAADLPQWVRDKLPAFEISSAAAWSSVALAGRIDRSRLDAWCASRPGCLVVDSIESMERALRTTHRGLLQALAASFAAIGLVLCVRYRRRGAFSALLLGAVLCGAIAAPALAGLPLTMLGTCGVFLLFGLSIDYLLFMLEGRRRRATWVAVCASAATTLATFSLLLFSATPAVQMIAMPVVAGVPLIVLLLFFSQHVLGGVDRSQPSLETEAK